MLGVTWVMVAVAVGVSMAAGDAVEVQLQQGVVRGQRSEDANGRHFHSFKSIPFAKPPVGDLRFRDPVPAEEWEGVLDGTHGPPRCPQFDLNSYFSGVVTVLGQEDCLYLSVYTSQPDASNLPVMVWIHGGGFVMGDAEFYEPGPLMRRDVVVVVIQYRLSTLGFLTTGDSAIPGNLGLKDQTMALHWVQENIRDFGGDPGKVTLFGESAGGASVHFHVLSPMSKGLFHRAIMQSGTALAPWALWLNQSQIAIRSGQLLECPGADSHNVDTQALASCLREKSVEQLLMLQNNFTEWMFQPCVMVPGIDGEFLPDHPARLLRQGRYNKVDIMSGITRDEGIISTRFMKDEAMLQPVVQNFAKLGPVAFGYQSWEDDPEYLARRTWYHYLGPINSKMDLINFDSFTKLYSYLMFNFGHYESSEHHARDADYGYNLFMYELDYEGQHDAMNSFFDLDLLQGGEHNTTLDGNQDSRDGYVGHADDLLYLFNLPNITLTLPEDLFVSRIMTDLWVNFADTGNPTPDLALGFKWDPICSQNVTQLSISTSPENTQPKVDKFWWKLPILMNKLLYPEFFITEHD